MRVLFGVWVGLLAFGLVHAADAPSPVANYRLAADHVVAVCDWEVDPSSPHVLVFTDFRTGRIGVLREVGENEWALPTQLMSSDEEARLRLTRSGGQVAALVLDEVGKAPRRAERIAHRTSELTFQSGPTTLQGTLWLPPGKGPFPAVALVPAGALGRAAAAPFTHFFLSEGYAVLAYDRRQERSTFSAYADDAVAAVAALRQRPEVDRGRIGLWGSSQGGWLSLMAAARTPTIVFVINYSGMLVPAWQQELYRLGAEAIADSVPLEVAQEAVAFETRLMRVAASGEGWDEVAARLAIRPPPAWHALVYKPTTLAELQQVWRDDFSFDPRPHVAGIRQPVLALYGALDRSTPIESAAHLVQGIGPRGTVEVELFPTGNHALLEASTGGNAEIPHLRRFAPGVLDTMRRWLKERR